MKKRYCDGCNKHLYDEIPQKPTVKLFGTYIPEVKIKRHCEYKVVMASIKRGIKAGVYCKECVDKMHTK